MGKRERLFERMTVCTYFNSTRARNSSISLNERIHFDFVATITAGIGNVDHPRLDGRHARNAKSFARPGPRCHAAIASSLAM